MVIEGLSALGFRIFFISKKTISMDGDEMIKATLIASLIPATGVFGSSILALFSPDICLCLFGGPPAGWERYIALALLVCPMVMVFIFAEYSICCGIRQLRGAEEQPARIQAH